MNDARIMYRIDRDLKQQFETVLDDLGLSLSAALTLFTKAVVRCGGIPFDVREPMLGTRTQKALDCSERQVDTKAE